MIEVIKDKKTWDELLSLMKESDFYYTYDYHHASKNEDEYPVLLKYDHEGTVFLLPLLLRDIKNSDYKDATSVYGYAGVLVSAEYTVEQKNHFQKELTHFLNSYQIVSVFSRLHPFFDYQEDVLSDLGKVSTQGKVVYIDLSETLEVQRAKFNKRLKTYLNKSRKLCTVIEGNVEDHLTEFMEIYHDNMRRVDADESYFFDRRYFESLFDSEDYNIKLLLCVHDETQEIIGGAIFIQKGTIVQYHLSGLKEEHFDLQPIKLIMDEMRIEATEEGFNYLNLGGGRGSNEDSLFRFKSSFSKDFKDFKLWKYIVNEQVYTELTINKLGENFAAEIHSGFFPAYRAKVNLKAEMH